MIYIAGSSGDLQRVKFWQARVQEFSASETATAAAPGIELTHNWVDVIEKRGHANPTDASIFERMSWAGEDLAGVREADLLWVLMPPGMSDGAMVELGYANALGKDIVVSGPNTGRTIFTSRGCEFETDTAAFDYIVDCYFNQLEESEPTQVDYAREDRR